MKRILAIAVVIVFSATLILAQNPNGPGRVLNGSYFTAGVDSVNLYNGNLMLDIPLISRAGREVPADLRLTYNSQGWQEFTNGWGTYGAYMGGFRMVNPIGGVSLSAYLVDCYPENFESEPDGYWMLEAEWVDPTGAKHIYSAGPAINYYYDGGCDQLGSQFWGNGAYLAPDQESPYTSYVLAWETGATLFLDGAAITTANVSYPRMVGRNGNYIEDDGGGLPIDTLGRSISTGSGGYTITDANGDPQTYTITSDTISVFDPIDQAWESLGVVEAIQLPNGRSYNFDYDHDQGFLTKVTLPSGGYIEYDWVGGNTSHNLADNYIVARRVSADGSSEEEWTYARSTSGSTRTIVVTNPEGDQVVHDFDTSTGYETQTRWRSGPTADPSKTVTITRSLWQVTQIDTQIGSLKQREELSWTGSWERMTQRKISDWYPVNDSLVPLLQIDYTYDDYWFTSPSWLTQVETKQWDAGSSQYVTKGKTQYFYDEYSLAATSNVPHKMSPLAWWPGGPAPRLNLTTIRSYKDASNYVEEHFHYDDAGNVVEHVDARAKSTAISYADNYDDSTNHYSAAFPTLVTNAEGHEVETRYNFNTSLPVLVTDARGQETAFTYDGMNRTLTASGPGGRLTTYTYDDETPKVTEEILVASGKVAKTETLLDLLYRAVRVQRYDPDGAVLVDTEYDGNGRVQRVSAPYRSGGSVVWTETDYDELSRPVKVTNPDSTDIDFVYTANTVTVTDEADDERRETRNGLGQLTMVEEPNPDLSSALSTTYSYDGNGALYQVVQGDQTRTMTHNWLGWLLEESHPETGTTSYSYNSGGMVTSRTDARNKTASYDYDDIGRLLSVAYDDSTPDVAYTYDQNGFTGLLTTVDVDGVTASTFEYDDVGQLSEENVTLDGVSGTFTTGYTYDLGGRLLTITYPSGRVVTRTYDSASGIASNRLDSLTDSPTSATLVGSVSDNAAGFVTARTLGGGISETRSFNNRLQLDGIGAAASSTTLIDLDYGYGSGNNTGRIRSRTDAVQPEHSVDYTYDAIGRLTAVTAADSTWSVGWALDRYGNRTSQSPSTSVGSKVGTQSFYYGSPNTTNRNSSWSYDNSGNVTNDGAHTYTYDAESRLVQVDSSSIQYAYDAGGRRIKKTAGGVTTYSFYGLTGLLSEFSNDTSLSDNTQAASNDRLSYRVGDPTGTALLLMDPSGNVLENNRVFPFGEPWVTPVSSANKETFTTYQRDDASGEAGLDYAMARYYASRSGRFMSPDPGHVGANLKNPQSWNAYTYGLNDSINYVDANGRWPFWIHEEIFDAALGRLFSPEQLRLIKEASWDADFKKGGASVQNAYQHGMCPTPDISQCRRQINDYLNERIGLAKSFSSGGLILGTLPLHFFGDAAHLASDMGSPEHTSPNGTPKVWNGSLLQSIAHTFGESSDIGNWFGIGQSIRNVVSAAFQAFPALLGEQNPEKFADRAIEDYLFDNFPFYYFSTRGSGLSFDEARACALGNPAACIE